MSEAIEKNPLIAEMRKDPLGRAQMQLRELRDHWANHSVSSSPVPLVPRNPEKPGRDWLPAPEWISGGDAFEMLRLQTEPFDQAQPIARLCAVICDYWDPEQAELNYALASLPPSHSLLDDFVTGSTQWFRALHSLLKLKGAEDIDGWEVLVSDIHDWIAMSDCLRIRTGHVLHNALQLDWQYHEISLPEAKQEPIWSLPKAMAWIATRDYLALARMGCFRRAEGDDEPVATDGVCTYNTQALGWLHSSIAYNHCQCGALLEFGVGAFKHCTCISMAWEDLVRLRGGLSPDTPELVFGLQEGWLSMTWPDGADDIRFLRRDILERWPARAPEQSDVGDQVLKDRKRPGPAPDPDWPHAIAKVTLDCITGGYKRPLRRGEKAGIQTMLLDFMASKNKYFSDDIAARHAEKVIAALPDR